MGMHVCTCSTSVNVCACVVCVFPEYVLCGYAHMFTHVCMGTCVVHCIYMWVLVLHACVNTLSCGLSYLLPQLLHLSPLCRLPSLWPCLLSPSRAP